MKRGEGEGRGRADRGGKGGQQKGKGEMEWKRTNERTNFLLTRVKE